MKIIVAGLEDRAKVYSSKQASFTTNQPTKTMNTSTQETVKIQIASAMDDCGTNEIRTIEMAKAEEATYNEGMARLAEMWG